MSCYGCGAGFSFFNKEHGCKNCGFAFCGKCLTKKAAIEKLNNEKHHVCNKCFNILTGKIKPEDDGGRYSPPEAFKKRVAALQEREEHGGSKHKTHTPSQTTAHKKHQYKGLSKSEREIAERLDKLKEKTPAEAAAAKVSEKDINARLAKLKVQDPSIQTAPTKPTYHPPERRTQQHQIDDLLDEIANEVEIDSHKPDYVAEVEGRLANLKDQPSGNEKANNLNRGDSQENKPFPMNIPQSSKGDNSKEDAAQSNDEISIEEMNKLIQEAAKEMELDAERAMEGLQKDKEIMKKLQEIKSRKKEDVNKEGDEVKDQQNEEMSDSDNENEEEMTKNLIKKLLEESKLDEAAARDGVDVDASASSQVVKKQNVPKVPSDQMIDDDELPYCCICTEDATIRCHGCDLDLYCKKCWNKSHIDFQMEDHETSVYKPPKGST